jgi:hypothetical protein
MPMNSKHASRAEDERPPGARLITSPYDSEARYSRKTHGLRNELLKSSEQG